MIRKTLVRLVTIATTVSLLALSVFAEVPVPGQGVNEGYTKPTKEQINVEQEKFKKAKAYVDNKRKNSTSGQVSAMFATSRVNPVGTFRQSTSYTCGPSSARNLIYGTYYSWGYASSTPSESTLSSKLGTTSSGTNFDATKW